MQRVSYSFLITAFFVFQFALSMDHDKRAHDLRRVALMRNHEKNIQVAVKKDESVNKMKKIPMMSYAMVLRRGDQIFMEDQASIGILDKENNHAGNVMLTICDGHHGDRAENDDRAAKYPGVDAASYAVKHLYKYIQNMVEKQCYAIEQSWFEVFTRVSLEILKDPNLTYQGTTALVAKINKCHATFSWVGDSRAIVMRDGEVIFTTIDHRPDDLLERNRIENDGAEVIYSDRARVNGDLPISRVLGNIYAKPYVVSTPQIATCDLKNDDLIILASDGVWKVMSNEQVAEVVMDALQYKIEEIDKRYPCHPHLRNKQPDGKVVEGGSNGMLERVARVLRDEAYIRGSNDNISAILFRIQANQ